MLAQGYLPHRLFYPGSLFGTLSEATHSSIAVTAAIRPSEDESCGCR